jgi:hypothetical protein
VPSGSGGSFEAGFGVGAGAALIGQGISRTIDSVWNLVLGGVFTGGDTSNPQVRENLARIAIESPMGSPLGNWFNAYPDTAASRALVEGLPASLAPVAQDAMMAYGATRGLVQSPRISDPRATQWGAPIDPVYNAWRSDAQPRTLEINLNPQPQHQPVITVLGSQRDTRQYANQPGFNVMNIPQNIPRTQWDDYNRYWLMNAYIRGDSFWLVTDPVGFAQVLRDARGTENVSAYFRVELPILNSLNVRQNAVPAYILPGGPPAIPPQRR